MNRARLAAKLLKLSLIGLAAIVILAVAIRQWVVPFVLVSKIEELAGCKVEIQSWWLNGESSGVVGLQLMDGGSAGERAFAQASRITTDLSLGSLLQGRFLPRRISLDQPEYVLVLDKEGRLLSTLGVANTETASPPELPSIVVQGGTVTVRQEGRPEMVVKQVTARVDPDSTGLALAARTADPRWGPLQAFGHFSRDFQTGKLELRSNGAVSTDPTRVRSIPFVPSEVWENVLPTGEIKIEATLERAADAHHSIHLETRIDLLGTAVRSPSLDLDIKGATGQVTIRDGLVTLKNIEGKALEGRVGANGKLDFESATPRVDLNLALGGIEVADAPARWQLGEAGVSGRLIGSVHLIALLKPTGIDLTGSSGEGSVDNGTIQGIPIKSIKLAMKAQGNDLQYVTPRADSKPPPGASRGIPTRLKHLRDMLTVAIQLQEIPKPEPPAPVPVVRKPESITTDIEMEDVDLAKVIARAQIILRLKVPILITGRFSLKATATIPLGQLQDVKGYAFHGDLKLSQAKIDGVDLGKVEARLDLANGLLNLTHLRGTLLDKPGRAADKPAERSENDVPIEGPLPVAGFRGRVEAELSPLGRLKARFEGKDLPLGELTAPLLPSSAPISGATTVDVEAGVDLANLMQAEAWELSGTASGRSIRYDSATLETSSSRFGLKQGRFTFEDVSAVMEGRPLKGRAILDIKSPQKFEAALELDDWSLASIFKSLPNLSPGLPIRGQLSGRANLIGTLGPLHFATEGSARIKSFQADAIAVGDLTIAWKTLKEVIHVELVDDQPAGGAFKAIGLVPLLGDDSINGSITLTNFDARRMSGLFPTRSLDLDGLFDGVGSLTIPRGTRAIDAKLQASSKAMRVKGMPAEHVEVHLLAERGDLRYKVKAESLGGTMSLNGQIPIHGDAENKENQPNGVFQTVNFQIEPILKALGQTGPLSHLQGRGAIDANLRASMSSKPHIMARGIAELRDLKWGFKRPVAIGLLKSVVELTPAGWRLDPVGGTILGGQVSGSAWGTFVSAGPTSQDFDIKIEHASLDQIEHLAPPGWPRVDGHATIRLVGSASEVLRAHLDVTIPQAGVEGIRFREIKLPVSYVSDPSGTSSVAHARQWTARVAGGTIRGDSTFRMGESRAFRSDIQVSDLELESLTKFMSDARQPATGKISGRIVVLGQKPDAPKSYRGQINLDLSDASLVALPIFREIDKFLGSARGGLFETGNLSGEIGNGQLNVNSLTLQGRVAQLHSTGTMGLDGQLDLGVLVNTSQFIPQTGKALAALIPGLGNLSARSRNTARQFAGFLSNRLLKLRVSGTVRNPSVALDPSLVISDSAASFFGGALNLPAEGRD